MKLNPILDYVLVQLDKSESVTKGGIIIPEAYQKKAQYGEVLAVGTGVPVRILPPRRSGEIHDEADEATPPVTYRDLQVKPGDKILCVAYGGVPVPEHEGQLVLREPEILAIVEP